ncbi:MAG: helix-turn-helix domain-containing protein [candidate division Zixibacteria bacterium]
MAIVEALKRTGGSLKDAAELLGIHRNTIRLKISKYGIEI